MEIGKLYRVKCNYPNGDDIAVFEIRPGLHFFVYAAFVPNPTKYPMTWRIKIFLSDERQETLNCNVTEWKRCFERIV